MTHKSVLLCTPQLGPMKVGKTMPEAGHGGFYYQDRATHFNHQPLIGQEIALAGSHYRAHYLTIVVSPMN